MVEKAEAMRRRLDGARRPQGRQAPDCFEDPRSSGLINVAGLTSPSDLQKHSDKATCHQTPVMLLSAVRSASHSNAGRELGIHTQYRLVQTDLDAFTARQVG